MSTSRLSISDSILRSNFRHLYADVFWWGLLAGSTLAFLAIYATRIGATSFQVGLLTAGPAVASLLVSLPAGRWLERYSLIRVTFFSSVVQRAGYLPLIMLPVLLTASAQVWSLEVLVSLMAVPGTLLAISFNAMFADIVPPDRRGHVVGWRNALVALSVAVTSLVCGWLLDRITFPLNYQIVFTIGALGGVLSSYNLARIRPPRASSASAQTPRQFPRCSAGRGKGVLRLDLLRGPFGPFMVVYLLFYTFQYIPIPLFPLAYVREIRLSDGAISLGSALFYGAMFLASVRLGRLSERLGHRRVLVLGSLFFGLYPLLIGLARDATLFWVASLAGGVAWALAGAGLVNRLMERVPPDDSPAHMALHNIVLNLGMLIGSLLGPALAEGLGLRQTILLGAGLRLLSGVLFGLWG